MGDVIKKMKCQMPERFLWFNIFLAAIMTIRSNNSGATVQTIPFFSWAKMRHVLLFNFNNFRLKIINKSGNQD
jgi:hypothetical protein